MHLAGYVRVSERALLAPSWDGFHANPFLKKPLTLIGSILLAVSAQPVQLEER